jgi:hypothetical protein
LGASKNNENLRKQIKREQIQSKGNYLFEFLNASIVDLITLLSSSVQNSEGGGDGDGRYICADLLHKDKSYALPRESYTRICIKN